MDKVPVTDQEASDYINSQVAIAYEAIRKAEQISKKFNIDFSFDLAYGMGGSFDPEEGEWMSSSASC